MGAVGGGIWHLLKGAKNSPSGTRLAGGIEVCLSSSCFAGWAAGGHAVLSFGALHLRWCLNATSKAQHAGCWALLLSMLFRSALHPHWCDKALPAAQRDSHRLRSVLQLHQSAIVAAGL